MAILTREDFDILGSHFPGFERDLTKLIAETFRLEIHELLPKPPRFRVNREISAKRARKLRKRGEYCHFVRWTVNGKCRYCWGGPTPQTFTFRMPRKGQERHVPMVTKYSLQGCR